MSKSTFVTRMQTPVFQLTSHISNFNKNCLDYFCSSTSCTKSLLKVCQYALKNKKTTCTAAGKPQVRHSIFMCLSWLMNSTDQTFFSCAHLISDHLRNNGDSWGHSCFGGSVCVGSGTTVHSLSARLSPLTSVCVVVWETWNDFTTSPEKLLIHTSTDRETRSSKKYLAFRKHLHAGVQTPMSEWQCRC